MRIAVIDDLKSDRQLLISRLNKLLSDNSINGEIYEFEKGIDFINASKQTAFEVAFMVDCKLIKKMMLLRIQ